MQGKIILDKSVAAFIIAVWLAYCVFVYAMALLCTEVGFNVVELDATFEITAENHIASFFMALAGFLYNRKSIVNQFKQHCLVPDDIYLLAKEATKKSV